MGKRIYKSIHGQENLTIFPFMCEVFYDEVKNFIKKRAAER